MYMKNLPHAHGTAAETSAIQELLGRVNDFQAVADVLSLALAVPLIRRVKEQIKQAAARQEAEGG